MSNRLIAGIMGGLMEVLVTMVVVLPMVCWIFDVLRALR